MKTVGTKLDNYEYEEFENYCNENGLTKSEQLRDLIKNYGKEKLSNSNSNSDIIPKNCTDCDEETHSTLRKISNSLHESYEYSVEEDDNGRPLRFSAEWIYD